MRNPDRLLELARAYNAYTKERLPTIELVRRDSIPTSPVDQADARQSLVLKKTSSVYYKDPTKQKRNLIRNRRERAALANPDNWIFNKAERYAVVDEKIRKNSPPGSAQVALAFDPSDPLDVNFGYVADNNGKDICTGEPNGWLDLVAGRNGQNDVSYIRLLTSFGANQTARDSALSIALERKAMETAQELLRNDANPNAIGIPQHFLAAIRDQNKLLYTMFLTATIPLNIFYINQALVEAIGRDPESDLVALLIAHGADGMLNEAKAVVAAISIGNLKETAMILVNPKGDLSTRNLDIAMTAAFAVKEDNAKITFLDMLLSAGADANTSQAQDELLVAVKKRQTSLVALLIKHGTSPDRNDAESLRLAVTSGEPDLVQVLLQGTVSQANTSKALGKANKLEDLDIYEDIIKALVEKDVFESSLSKCLSDTVGKGCASLVPVLIEKGATLDYDKARCVRIALERNDFSLFRILLEVPCQPDILSEILPYAMAIQSSAERLDIVTQLLNKDVSGTQLHIALQKIAKNPKDQMDYSLIQILIKKHASVDYIDKNGNCVCTAAKQQDEKALDLLCEGNPSENTVSAAISFLPVSFATAEAAEYAQQVGMMSTLLEKGAHGTSVAQLLIKAVRDDYRETALTALIDHQGDANYENGKAIQEALQLTQISALELICKHCKIESTSFSVQLLNALKPENFSLHKFTLLAGTTKKYNYPGILDLPLIDEVENNGTRKEVISLLLELGADVNFQHGRALQHAVRTGNVDLCDLLFSAPVEHSNIALAFPSTSEIVDRPTRYLLMQALLKAGKYGIGQDQALVQASQEAIQYDLSHVELLLQHQASANFNEGAAVLRSIETKNLLLLKRLMLTELNEITVANAFSLARKIECTQEERYDMFETLLEAYHDEIATSSALIEVVLFDASDIKTATLLLNHGASLEPEHGLAIQVVSSAGSLDLLNIFLGKNPSQMCRDGAFDSTIDSDLSAEHRNQIYRSLLERGIRKDLVSKALLQATQADTIDQPLLNLLVDFNASLDFEAGEAVHETISHGDLSTLNVLLRGVILQKETLDRSFSASMALAALDRLPIAKALLEKDPGVSRETVSYHLAQIAKENDHDLLKLMMNYQPDPSHNDGESLVSSARAGDARSVELLTKVEIHNDILNNAFEQLLASRAIQLKPGDGLRTAKILLSFGVAQHLRDQALLEGFDNPIDQITKDLVDLLIPYRPNFSFGEGKIFVDIASISDVELFRLVASQKPDLNIVIPALIKSTESEEELISFLEHLEECAQRDSALLHDSVLFTALTEFPEGHLLANHLLNHGCPAKSKVDAELYPTAGIETMTALIWALSRGKPNVSEDVILQILDDDHDAEISFATTVTLVSATIMASTTGKNTVLKRLIELGIDISHRDRDEHSALFYASRLGHAETVRILVQAGAKGDDGSLHEAAREAHPEIVEFLLDNDHGNDFPSALHADGRFGRTALEELCLRAKPRGEDWQRRIYESISLLLPVLLVNIPKSDGKTMLHLALDNESSVDVIRELLEFPAVWKNINESIYLYEDEQGYFYSPTKYVEFIVGAARPEIIQPLTTLLHARKCKDRFYAHTVDQPDGAIGLPEEVAEAVNKQNRADHEHREELKRRNAIATHQRTIEAEDYERNLRQDMNRHNLLMQQLKVQDDAEKQIARDKERAEQELARQRQNALIEEARIRVAAVNEEGARRRAIAEREQASELTHRKNLEQMESRSQQVRLATEQALISARDTASKNEFNRQTALCDYKDNSAKYQADQRQRAAAYSN